MYAKVIDIVVPCRKLKTIVRNKCEIYRALSKMQKVSNAANPRHHPKNTCEILSLDETFIKDKWQTQRTRDIRCRKFGALELFLLIHKIGVYMLKSLT